MLTVLDCQRIGISSILSIALLGDDRTGGRFSGLRAHLERAQANSGKHLDLLHNEWKTCPISYFEIDTIHPAFQSLFLLFEREFHLKLPEICDDVRLARPFAVWSDGFDGAIRSAGFDSRPMFEKLYNTSTSVPLEDVVSSIHSQNNSSSPQQQASGSSQVAEADPIIQALLDKNYDRFKEHHLGLQKALIYIAEHYAEDITLGVIANASHVGTSHMSYLFKVHLATTFKSLLNSLRIERAKQILHTTPNTRITDISLAVGFGDLPHFEKMFKRMTGMTPREYKRNVANG